MTTSSRRALAIRRALLCREHQDNNGGTDGSGHNLKRVAPDQRELHDLEAHCPTPATLA